MLVGAVGLPILVTVVFLVQQLLMAMGDDSGALWLRRCGLMLLVAWGADLIALLVVTAIRQLRQNP